jgi:hypothetical protein
MFLGFSDSLSSNHRFRESCDTICICNAKAYRLRSRQVARLVKAVHYSSK